MRHETKHLLNPVALIPGLNQPRHLDVEGHRDQIKRLVTGLVDHHEPHLTIGTASSSQPHITTPWGMKTPFPEPIVDFDQVRALDFATVFEGKSIVAFALPQ